METTTRPGVSIYDRFLSAVLMRCRERTAYSIESNISYVMETHRLFESYWYTRTPQDRNDFIVTVQARLEKVR